MQGALPFLFLLLLGLVLTTVEFYGDRYEWRARFLEEERKVRRLTRSVDDWRQRAWHHSHEVEELRATADALAEAVRSGRGVDVALDAYEEARRG
jgi:hypothetical protein